MMANGHKMSVQSEGFMDVTFIQRNGSKVDKTIKVKYSPDHQQKLFIFTAAWPIIGQCKGSSRIE